MNPKIFPWYKLIFTFIFALVLGFIYSPIESMSLPWFVEIIAIPFVGLIYVITDTISGSLLEELERVVGKIFAWVVFFLTLGSGLGAGILIFDLLTALIQSLRN